MTDTGITATLLESSIDPQAKQATMPGGMRGERSPADDHPEFEHEIDGPDGEIVVEETSGVAFVEASGRAPERPGRAEQAARTGRAMLPATSVVAALALGYWLGRRSATTKDDAAQLSTARASEPMPAPLPLMQPSGHIDGAADRQFSASDSLA